MTFFFTITDYYLYRNFFFETVSEFIADAHRVTSSGRAPTSYHDTPVAAFMFCKYKNKNKKRHHKTPVALVRT